MACTWGIDIFWYNLTKAVRLASLTKATLAMLVFQLHSVLFHFLQTHILDDIIANRGNPSWVPYWINALYCGWRKSPIRNPVGHIFSKLSQIALRHLSPYLHIRSKGKTLGMRLAHRFSVFILLPVRFTQSDSTLTCLHLFISYFSSGLCKQSIASFIVRYSF